MAKLKPVIVFAQQDWNSIEALVEHTVVQVCAESREFNWASHMFRASRQRADHQDFLLMGMGILSPWRMALSMRA